MTSFFWLSTFLTMFILQWDLAHSCSPEHYKRPTPVEVVTGGRRFPGNTVVIIGKMLSKFRGEDDQSTAYTAEMEVYCSLVGPPLPARVNITKAGYTCCFCDSTDLKLKKTHIVAAYSPYEDSYDVLRALPPQVDTKDIKQAVKACGINQPTYPIGVDASTARYRCPKPMKADQCLEH